MVRQILLFNDFGWQGPYVGQMLSVLHGADTGSTIVPVQCDAPSGDPRRSAYLLAALVAHSPPNSIWVCVVDPGVGGERRPIIASANGRWLVGPDNGLLAPSLCRTATPAVWRLDWRPGQLSATFHGRDLFAPVAARLARDEPVDRSPLAPAGLEGAEWPADLWEVVYIDGFGNCMTGIRGELLAGDDLLLAADHRIGHCRTFCEGPRGRPFWYVNSVGLAEIAVNLGRADECLGLTVGSGLALV